MRASLFPGSLFVCLGWSIFGLSACDHRTWPDPPRAIDVLFVLDNSHSMAEELMHLGEATQAIAEGLEKYSGQDNWHIGVVTTGIESEGCPPCTEVPDGCINESGEGGKLQDRRGLLSWVNEKAQFTFERDPNCKVVSSSNLYCVYEEQSRKSIVLVGANGCGYERGLSAMRKALSPPLVTDYHPGFLRSEARLVVVVVSDEEDCGERGDVAEMIFPAGGNICNYASNGIGPEGETSHPDDPDQKLYELTPVDEYHDFLMGLKDHQPGMVKFAAIVGLKDLNELSTTVIEYFYDESQNRWDIVPACSVPECLDYFCEADPGTRYIELAQKFGLGQNGYLDTICQRDLTLAFEKLIDFVTAPSS